MKRRPAAKQARDRGSVAVEFALLLPILLLLVFGVVDFGRAISAQITLTQAAREGARLAALGQPNSTVVSRAQAAATGLSPVTVTVTTSCPVNAGAGVDAVVQTSYAFSFVTPVGSIAAMFGGVSYGSPVTLSAQGEMPCET
jgi:Flp pilus assembly protein TadG